MSYMENQMQSLYDGSNYEMDQHYKERENAFNALLEYEKNCILKYDRPNKHSLPPKMGERMVDYAGKFNTTIELMKNESRHVEEYLEGKGNR